MYVFKKEQGTYHPQKTEGKPYKCKQGQQTNLYGIEEKEKVTTENKGDRHPTSIIDHENIYVFDNPVNEEYNDLELSRNENLINYSKKVLKHIGKTKTTIKKKIPMADHFFRYSKNNFSLLTKETYEELIKEYNIDEMDDYLEYEILESLWEKSPSSTYNPQKTEGKPYKVKGRKSLGYYGENSNFKESYLTDTQTDNKGDRHPTSIIDHESMYIFKKEQGTYNPQKTKGKAYNKTNTGNNNKDSSAYGIIDRSSHLEGEGNRKINKGDRHPTSIIDHENIYVFDATITDDIDRSRNKDLREYAEKVKKFINKPLKEIEKKLGNMGVSHFYSFKGSQFGLPTKKTYDFLIKEYNIDEMEEYLEYDILEGLWEKEPSSIYNPQKTEGKPYKCKEGEKKNDDLYNIKNGKRAITENKGDRHPTSIINEIPEYEGDTILVYKNPHKTIHRTQKPVELLEWLIKTYSNEGDTVMDFTMGSGTCGIACMNTKRKFIGAEMDEEIYNLSLERFKKNIE